MEYTEFLESKKIGFESFGIEVDESELNPMLFDWQKIIVKWALKKGRAALFEDCGLGKTPQQLEWANQICQKTQGNVLILAPLAVSKQTKEEGNKFGIKVHICKDQSEVKSGINITNYEKLHNFEPSTFTGIVLDESGILKNFAGKYKNEILEAFQHTKYKLACTATPAPNDYIELGNHAEFLGVCSRSEMLSMFFINDASHTGDWRLKGHVKENIFWQWMSSWCVMLSKPSDLGFEDDGFTLPEIKYHEHIIKSTAKPKRGFFLEEAATLNDRRKVRSETNDIRCKAAADLINSTNDLWVCWCNLNPEGDLLTEYVDNALQVAGRHSDEIKAKRMLDFAHGDIERLVTKPKIAGLGMNWQICHKAAFVGLSDSWEQFYQATRRIYRFGQTKPVEIHIFIEEREGAVLRNIQKKDEAAKDMMAGMVQHMQKLTISEFNTLKRSTTDYNPSIEMELPGWITQ